MYILESFDKELYEQDLKQNAYDDGIKEGENKKLISQIRIKLDKGMNVNQIAAELEETVEMIETLMQEMDK